jgi:hypothetical protein
MPQLNVFDKAVSGLTASEMRMRAELSVVCMAERDPRAHAKPKMYGAASDLVSGPAERARPD